MNPNKFAFIIVSNNQTFLNESVEYINRIEIPDGFSVELFVINEATSMLNGMDEGKSATDAKYKIFMHQDVFIINKYFLYDILTIFQSDPQIGLIGMVGTPKLSSDAVMWNGKRMGHLYTCEAKNLSEPDTPYKIEDGIMDMQAIDGLMMISAYDIPLRTDLLDGWDFYDVSTSLEYLLAGYRVVVPYQHKPWVIHDDGHYLSLWNYDKYRHIVLEEYHNLIHSNQ